MKRLRQLLFPLALTAFSAGSWALATPEYATGVAAYDSGHYGQALISFTQELQVHPEDSACHYYAALCLQQLNRLAEAGQEYHWVLNHSRDQQLIERAQVGLNVLSQSEPLTSFKSRLPAPPLLQIPGRSSDREGQLQQGYEPSVSPSTLTAAAADGQPASNTASQPAARQAAQVGGNVRPLRGQVLDFYTDWCSYCTKFTPFFEEAQEKYRAKLLFASLDAEAKENVQLVERFNLKGYPTIIFLDADGRFINRIDGAPQSMQEFENAIKHSFPRLKSR